MLIVLFYSLLSLLEFVKTKITLKFYLIKNLFFQLGFDVFNALDLMDNKSVLEELKFGIGDGNLQYYLYNWKCPDMTPERIGLVLQ